ncbi:hypothetical protein Q8F55_000833 [Vanrija albida]|uniref:Ribosomal protein S2 n=1 Tax=Vanrija albida TaxID=181172 RepID=A0ABR3QEF4_9TREE
MKGAASTSIRAARAAGVRPAVSARTFTSTPCSRDASAEAESSTSTTKYTIREGESVVENWTRNLSQVRDWRRRYAAIKSQVPLYIPEAASKPKVPSPSATDASLSTLLASGAALGHSSQLLAPAFSPYVYGTRAGLSIIDLEQTLPLLRRAATLVRDVAKADGVILFVGTRRPHKKLVVAAAERLGDNGFATDVWMPGMLTNAETYFGMDVVKAKTNVPDLVVFLNPSENVSGVRECTARNVPTIGVVDSNTDPRVVTYAIPANMESVRTAELIAGALSIAGQEGRRMRLREAAQVADRRGRDAEWRRRAASE